MKLIECYIESFGKLSNMHFDFTDGLNIILAENGYGKTTLSFFIKCMLYGMDDTKKQSLDENERKKYLPWSGALAGGSLTFETGGKTYRAERSFAPKAADDTFILYDTALGRVCEDFTENLGQDILGINADGFLRTLFLSERILPEKNDNKTISSKLSELVGCDGDISSMSDAMKLLDEQRKFYMKKGGSGEISAVESELSRTAELLAEINRCEEKMKQAETNISELSEKENLLRREEINLNKEREILAKLGSDESYRKTLSEMKAALAVSETRRNELIEFFGGVIPSDSDIDRAKMTEAEIRRLALSATQGEDSEFLSLRAVFENRVTPEDITSAKEAYDRLRLGSYPKSDKAVRKATLFAKRTPTKEELSTMEGRVNEKISLPILPLISGLSIFLIGLISGFFVNSLLFVIAVFGIGLMAFSPILRMTKEKKRNSEIYAFFTSLSDSLTLDKRSPVEIINELRCLLETDETENTAARLDEKMLLKFASLFGKGANPITDTEEILKKYDRYKELLAVEKYKAAAKDTALSELSRKKNELNEFVRRFRCVTDSPINEISVALSEYTSLSADIVTKRTAITSLSSNHKLSDLSADGVRTAEELNKADSELAASLSEISREKALLERQYRDYAEKVDMREEVLSKKQELEEKLNKYNDDLETVLLAKKYLDMAKENMTSKYLGKTKSGFEKYSSLISGEEGSFEMDTSFTVSKTEGAKTHSTEAYSRGTRELYAIAVRFALIDSLYEEERPFVILDDPFISLDDEKCKKALEIIKEISKERQIIYFTCSGSRA